MVSLQGGVWSVAPVGRRGPMAVAAQNLAVGESIVTSDDLRGDVVELGGGSDDSFLATLFAEMPRMTLPTTFTLTFRPTKRFVPGRV